MGLKMQFPNSFLLIALLLSVYAPAPASETDALAISAAIQARHMPFGTILNPIYSSPASNDIIGYTRCGDSALWTGAYLAAEAFRYKVTQSADALVGSDLRPDFAGCLPCFWNFSHASAAASSWPGIAWA